MSDLLGVVVELHKDTGDSPGLPATGLNPWVRSVSWVGATHDPWDSVSLTLRLPMELLITSDGEGTRIRPVSGDWIVIRESRKGPLLALGYVDTANYAVSVEQSPNDAGDAADTVSLSDYQVSCIGWMDLLNRVQVLASATIKNRIGTIFSLQSWSEVIKALVMGATEDVGPSLSHFLYLVAQVKMPKSLGESLISNMVAVVHGIQSRNAYASVPDGMLEGAPRREAESIPGPTLNALQAVGGTEATSVTGLMVGAYGADPGMIEMFPTIEGGGDLSLGDDPVDTADIGKKVLLLRRNAARSRTTEALDSQPGDESSAANVRTANASLQRNLVLMYRMRPWRDVPLGTYKKYAKKWRMSTLGMFDGVTWNPEQAVTVKRSKVFSLALGIAENDKINAVTVGLPFAQDSAVRYYQSAGLPVQDKSSVIRHGLRLYQPNWPFLPDIDNGRLPKNFNYLAFMRTIALQAYQWHYDSSRFLSGVATVHFDPRLRHGEIVRVEVPEKLLPKHFKSDTMVGYAEKVEHTITVVGSTAMKRTTVSFVRGLYSEQFRSAPEVDIPRRGGREAPSAQGRRRREP